MRVMILFTLVGILSLISDLESRVVLVNGRYEWSINNDPKNGEWDEPDESFSSLNNRLHFSSRQQPGKTEIFSEAIPERQSDGLSQKIEHARSSLSVLKILQLFRSLTKSEGLGCDVVCIGCELVIFLSQAILKIEGYDAVAKDAVIICKLFQIEKDDVCQGVINEFKNEFLDVLSNTTLSATICEMFLPSMSSLQCQCSKFPDWNVTFPNIPKPPINPPKPPKPGSPKLNILHLTDLHIDFSYKPGSDAECGKPLCCQDGVPKGKPAGKWGDYRNCDIPIWTVEDLFKNLSKTSKFDYILWTGDLPNHHIWNQTREEQLEKLNNLTRLFLKYFPKTPVFPSVGNHESAPVNSFPPPFETGNRSISWLYNALFLNWMNWLPNSTASDITRGGFYTFLVRPGFRIVSLNTNYCHTGNLWLFLNTTDPAAELSWLIDVLQNAETNKEKVHIIGHIPTGAPECLKVWSWNYYRIINRYESIIAAQFFGHTHTDRFEIYYDMYTGFKRPLSVGYTAPSLTTYTNLNPGYRVYEIDGFYNGSTWTVLDHSTFIMNLTESNLKDEPVWLKEYSAKETYNMSSLTPADWDDLSKRFMNDNRLFSKYLQYYYKSVVDEGDQPCDATCRKLMVCQLRCGLSNDLRPCHDLFSDSEIADLPSVFSKWSRL